MLCRHHHDAAQTLVQAIFGTCGRVRLDASPNSASTPDGHYDERAWQQAHTSTDVACATAPTCVEAAMPLSEPVCPLGRQECLPQRAS